MFKIGLVVLMTIVAMSVKPSETRAATVAPAVRVKSTIDARVMAAAKEWFLRFQSGNIDRSQLDAKTNADLSDAMIRSEAATLSKFGKPSAMKFVQSAPIGDLDAYSFSFEFRSGRVIESIAFDKYGKIAGIDFQTFVAR